tara:strand:- start:231 stop:464 length:234 start_codon:yes stop_codon:yes gene_type:complete
MKTKQNKEAKPGSLVYVPSETLLVESEDPHQTTYLFTLQEPKVFLVLEKSESSYRVLHKGQKWFVPKNKSYEVKNDS